jgi:hypothetical protein
MMAELNLSTFKRLVSEKNFLAAYMLVKESTMQREESLEHTGNLVKAIIDEMAERGARGDKNVFYRSLLLFIFEDIPAFGRIYARQLRLLEESKSSFDVLKNIRAIIDASNDKEELKAKIEETLSGIKEKIEDTTQDIRDGTAQQKMEDFFYVAGEGIKEGLRQFASFMKSMTPSTGGEETGGEASGEKKEDDTIRQQAEPVEETEKDKEDRSGESKSE